MKEALSLLRTILSNEHLSEEDNFFVAGGDSVKAGLVISELRKRWNAELSYGDIFSKATIGEILASIVPSSCAQETSRTVAGQEESMPLTIQQEEILTHEMIYKSDVFKILAKVEIQGQVEEKLLRKAVEMSLNSFPLFKTTVDLTTGKNMLLGEKAHYFWRASGKSEEKLLEGIISKIGYTAETVKVGFYLKRYTSSKSILYVGLHHLWGDESTVKILLDAIASYYQKLVEGTDSVGEEVSFGYTKFALLQKEQDLQHYSDYWKEKLRFAFQSSTLKRNQRKEELYSAPEYGQIQLNEQTVKKLESLAKECESSLYSVYFSLLKLLIYECTEESHVYVGFPLRSGASLGGAQEPGNYVSQSLSTIEVNEQESLKEFIFSMQQEILTNMDYSMIPFRFIAEKLPHGEHMKGFPQQIHFNFIDEDYEKKLGAGVYFKELSFFKKVQSSEFELILGKRKDRTRASFVYKKGLFDRDYINNLLDTFLSLMERVCNASPQDKIGDLIRKEENLYEQGFNL